MCKNCYKLTYLVVSGWLDDGFPFLDLKMDQLGAVPKDDFSISASD